MKDLARVLPKDPAIARFLFAHRFDDYPNGGSVFHGDAWKQIKVVLRRVGRTHDRIAQLLSFGCIAIGVATGAWVGASLPLASWKADVETQVGAMMLFGLLGGMFLMASLLTLSEEWRPNHELRRAIRELNAAPTAEWRRTRDLIVALDAYVFVVERMQFERDLVAAGGAVDDPKRMERWNAMLIPAKRIIEESIAAHLKEANIAEVQEREMRARAEVATSDLSGTRLQIAVKNLADDLPDPPESPSLAEVVEDAVRPDVLAHEEALREVIAELERERNVMGA